MVIKTKNLAHITASIIQKSQQLNIQSSGLKLGNLSYFVSSVDRKNVFTHELLVANIFSTTDPKLFIFTNHIIKHKTITN